jgi:hypothetical protein
MDVVICNFGEGDEAKKRPADTFSGFWMEQNATLVNSIKRCSSGRKALEIYFYSSDRHKIQLG